MPIINPDLSEISGPLAAGTYAAEVTAVEAKSSKSGNPMIVVDFRVTTEDTSVKRRAFIGTSGAGAYSFESLLRATGFGDAADNLKSGVKAPFDTDDLLGQHLNLVIEPDEYEGQLRDKIKTYLRV